MPDPTPVTPPANPEGGATNNPTPTGNDPKPTGEGANPTPAELMIPKHRFDETNAKLKELETWKADQESKAKLAEEESLKKRGEWEQLAKTREEEATQAKTQLQTERTNNRLITEASKQGVVDADAVLALVDRGAIKIDAEGNITGIEEAVKALVEAKPYLKGGSSNQPTVGNGTNPGQSSNSPITKFKASQLQDVAFFREHQKEIMLAMKNNLIEDDLP